LRARGTIVTGMFLHIDVAVTSGTADRRMCRAGKHGAVDAQRPLGIVAEAPGHAFFAVTGEALRVFRRERHGLGG